MRNGVSFDQSIGDRELELYKLGGFDAAHLVQYHTRGDVHRLREANPASTVLVRLPDSVREDGTLYSWEDYAEACAAVVYRFLPEVVDFQLDNAPNMTWTFQLIEGRPATAGDYQWFLGKVFEELRQLVPRRVSIGAPALAWGEGTSSSGAAPSNARRWLSVLGAVLPRFDFLCANVQWQTSRDITSPKGGGSFQLLHELYPDKPLVISEWNYRGGGEVGPESVQETHYPAWSQWVRGLGYVGAAYVDARTLTRAGAAALGGKRLRGRPYRRPGTLISW